MSSDDWASGVYREYMATGFGEVHPCSRREYELYARYFARNWDSLLPQDLGAPVLDLGCGAGHFLYYLRKRGCTAYKGIDLSEQCVEVCRREGLPAERADAFEYLAGRQGTLGAIVVNDVFEHLTRERGLRLAALCREALCPGAPLIVKVPNAACPVGGARARYCDITHESGFTGHSLRTLLRASGFTETEVIEPDIYVTRNPVANVCGRALFRLTKCVFRVLYYLYGISRAEPLTKDIIAVATARSMPGAVGGAER